MELGKLIIPRSDLYLNKTIEYARNPVLLYIDT